MTPGSADVPVGMDFWNLVWDQEDRNELKTDNFLPEAGEKAPACLEQMGTTLSLLDRMASCWWGCQQGDHHVEYLCGRAASNARAGIRLMRIGFYDQSLVLARANGEVANLLGLFVFDKDALSEWKVATRRERQNSFGPTRVRIKLEDKGIQPVPDQEAYRLLSKQGVHVHPGMVPQSFNALGIPTIGDFFQEEGTLICLNELALPIIIVTFFGSLLLNVTDAVKEEIQSASRSLVDQIGQATLANYPDYRQWIKAQFDVV